MIKTKKTSKKKMQKIKLISKIKPIKDKQIKKIKKLEVKVEVKQEANTKTRRNSNSTDKMYFTNDTQSAITEYNKETCSHKREEIYNNKIKYAFEKLVENIFNTFKFSYFEMGPLDVQRDTLSHLVANIEKYDESKGKAFSYFSIIAKHYLIFHNNHNFKQFNRHVDITEEHEDHGIQLQVEDKHHSTVQSREFMSLMITFWDNNMTKIFKKQRDLSIAQSVVELFRNMDRIDAFNKKALYLYIREMSGCKTQHITKIINKMKQYQKQISRSYINNGIIR